jgi:hypothetical protein
MLKNIEFSFSQDYAIIPQKRSQDGAIHSSAHLVSVRPEIGKFVRDQGARKI